MMNIEEVLDILSRDPGMSAYVCDAGIFLRRAGRVIERLSVSPPPSKFPRGSISVEKVLREVDENDGACDIGYGWKNSRVVNAIRRVGGDLTVEIRVYPQDPPGCRELGLTEVASDLDSLDGGGIVLVAGGRNSGRTTVSMALCERLAHGRFVLALEDPITYKLPLPEDGIIAQREVGIYGDVPSFAEGIVQAGASRPDVLYVSDVPDGESARGLVIMAGSGSLVICEMFGADPADAVRRVLLKGEQGLPADVGRGWRQGFINHLYRVIFCPYTEEGRPSPFVLGDEDLLETKNAWTSKL